MRGRLFLFSPVTADTYSARDSGTRGLSTQGPGAPSNNSISAMTYSAHAKKDVNDLVDPGVGRLQRRKIQRRRRWPKKLPDSPMSQPCRSISCSGIELCDLVHNLMI